LRSFEPAHTLLTDRVDEELLDRTGRVPAHCARGFAMRVPYYDIGR
jgi:hypothetical protein